jgi:hypothetical protein
LFDAVFYVMGNHEFYQDHSQGDTATTMEQKEALTQTICGSFPNVYFLSEGTGEEVVIERLGVCVLGTTLWSKCSERAASMIRDYANIWLTPCSRLTVHDANQIHQHQRDYLTGKISSYTECGYSVLVITHHLPTYALVPSRFRHDTDLNSAFASSTAEEDLGLDKEESVLEDGRSAKHVWVAGHSHGTRTVWLGDWLFGLNAFGYNGDNRDGYKRRCVFSVA